MPARSTLCVLSLLAASLAFGQSSLLIQTLAGSRRTGDGGPATAAPLAFLEGVAADAFGNVYLADAPDHRIRRLRPNGIIETIAGTGEAGFSGDGGPGAQARIHSPYGIAVDPRGNVFFADYGNQRIRRVAPNGVITTVAGGGTSSVSFFGAALPALQAALAGPRNLAIDAAGQIYFSDYAANRVLRLSPDGQLTHFAGAQRSAAAPDSVTAVIGPLKEPTALAIDRAGAVYIADAGNYAIRRVFGGVMTRVTSTGTAARVTFDFITGLAIDANGELYIAEGRGRPLRRISPQGAVVQFAEGGRDVAVDAAGNVFLADGAFLRRLSRQTSAIVAGNGQYFFAGEMAPATEARFRAPSALALDRAGNLYIADRDNHRVRRLGTDGRVLTVAGTGTAGAMLAPGAAAQTPLNQPSALAVDAEGAVWVADTGNRAVRKFWPGGRIEHAISSSLRSPAGLAFDRAGNLYVADSAAHRIFVFSPRDGSWTPFAGTGNPGLSGDGGPPLAAELNRPTALAFDQDGALLICDTGNSRIRRITTTGVIEPYSANLLIEPTGLAPAADGLYVSDSSAHRIVWIGQNGARGEVAGLGLPGFSGDNALAAEALLNRPTALLLTPTGALLVADTENHLVRSLSRAGLLTGESRAGALLSAASLREAPAVPGQLMKLTGSGLGPAQGVAAVVGPSGRLEPRLEGVDARFDGLPAPLLYVQDAEVQFQVPAALQGRARAVLEVWWQGTLRAQVRTAVEDIAPSLFLLEGAGAQLKALNEDGNLNLAENPAERGSVVTLFATGSGLWDRDLADGTPSPAGLAPRAPVTATLDGREAEVVFAGAAPGLIGTLQVNLRVPRDAKPGDAELVLRIGGVSSKEKATLAVK